MTMQKNLLIYDIALLLVRHGHSPVMRELARQMGLSEHDFMNELDRLRKISEKPPVSKRKASEFSIQKMAKGHPEIEHEIALLDARYENRTFLPELRDVKRFLERNGRPSSSLKSRQSSKKKVFEALLRFDKVQLRDILDERVYSSNSALGIISDQILRQKINKGD